MLRYVQMIHIYNHMYVHTHIDIYIYIYIYIRACFTLYLCQRVGAIYKLVGAIYKLVGAIYKLVGAIYNLVGYIYNGWGLYIEYCGRWWEIYYYISTGYDVQTIGNQKQYTRAQAQGSKEKRLM